jgi:branched-chain amino acid transport system ATP-binding protein
VSALSKHFGGLKVTDNVSLELADGEIHSVIGPNGAGKSSLLAQLCGLLTADRGCIELRGENVTRWSAARRAREGLARTFQITSVFREFTAHENVLLACQAARFGHAFSFWMPARSDKDAVDESWACLERVGLAAHGLMRAENLSGGEQRALEIAMALSTRPKVLLLDEPMAGMGHEDTERLTRLILSLRGTVSVLLVEHDMDVVFRVSDRLSVLVYGRVIASGDPETVRLNEDVRHAYLGVEDAADA